ncbi:hypothetical protein [Pseudoduganella sp. HUAS MS19]
MSLQPTEQFDALEDTIEELGIPVERILEAYRKFLLQLIATKRFTGITSSDIQRVENYLTNSVKVFLSMSDDQREKIRVELWSFADACRKTNNGLYSLLRCVIILYGEPRDWETAQDSPIYYCLLPLTEVIPDVEPEFISHFQKTLFRT